MKAKVLVPLLALVSVLVWAVLLVRDLAELLESEWDLAEESEKEQE